MGKNTMEITYTIYKATNTINDECYIGVTRFTLDERKKKHLIDYKLDTFKHRKFYAALNEYGEDAFTWEAIDTASNKADAINREKYWIGYYDSCKHGYNANTGGSGTNGYKYSAEQLKVMSMKKLGVPKSDEHKKAMSKAAMGKHRGELSGMSKLTDDKVKEIKRLLATTSISINELGEMFNCHPSNISNIKCNRTWKHIQFEEAITS
ncbi:GIY-YIG nuclease family protein [Planococcus sp. SIMBA_143]